MEAGSFKTVYCPKCEKEILIEKKVKGKNVNVHICPKCKGIWFDRNELQATINAPEIDLKVPSDAKPQKYLCPKCSDPLYIFCYPKTMVLIDACKKCSGIWLDNRELIEIHAVQTQINKNKQEDIKINCPKCGFEQTKSDECIKCGIIFSKYRIVKEETLQNRKSRTTAKEQGIASISGMKRSLLRFIDSSIKILTHY